VFVDSKLSKPWEFLTHENPARNLGKLGILLMEGFTP